MRKGCTPVRSVLFGSMWQACCAIPDIFYSALVRLIEGEENLGRRGTILWLASVNPGLMEVLKRSPIVEILSDGRHFRGLPSAAAAYEKQQASRVREGS